MAYYEYIFISVKIIELSVVNHYEIKEISILTGLGGVKLELTKQVKFKNWSHIFKIFR